MLYFCYSVLTFSILTVCAGDEFRVWGPGLSPTKIVLPARYFFVELSSNESQKVSIDELVKVDIYGRSKRESCRLWVNKLDRKDGSLIVRYRLYETCDDLKITITHENKHIGDSPYYFKGPIYHEHCDCPAESFDKWAQDYECPNNIEQIDADMKHFDKVNMTLEFKRAMERFDQPGSISLCLYSIKNNLLYRKCYGKYVGFHIFSDAILLSVLRKVRLPDQTFFINLGDWPLVTKSITPPIPIFSWCGSTETYDIVLPTYDLTESSLENMGRVMLDMLSIQGNIEKPWAERKPLAFWRGRDARRERLKLIDIARENPTLYNASLTNFFFFRDEETKYGPKVPHVSFFEFFNYKYQINIDGTVAAYRLPYLLIGGSLVLKQESPYYEHFYNNLIPGEHYLPFKRDLSDLTEKIQWAIENDEAAQNIAEKGREFARNFLMPNDIICYYAIAFNEWSKRVINPEHFLDEMELVVQEDKSTQKCKCDNNDLNHSKEEL